MIPAPFADRPPPVEPANPLREKFAAVIADMQADTDKLALAHQKQELRRRVEVERDRAKETRCTDD